MRQKRAFPPYVAVAGILFLCPRFLLQSRVQLLPAFPQTSVCICDLLLPFETPCRITSPYTMFSGSLLSEA